MLFPIIGAGSSTHAFTRSMFDTIIDESGQSILDEYSEETYKAYYNGSTALISTLSLRSRSAGTWRRTQNTTPGFLVIDTPLLGLDQGVTDAAPESMRTALFKFFINHQNDGQIIILENMMHIPALDYEGSGANVITFTKGLEAGRYGFLNDVK